MRHRSLIAGLLLALGCAPTLAQFASEEANETGEHTPSVFSWRYYLEQMDRFPKRLGILCYNAYLLDKTDHHGDALKFAEECARRGNPPSMIFVATFYEVGRGVKRDLAEAARWLRRAAETDYAPGQYHYGVALLLGRGVPRDMAAGKAWIRRAADQDDADARALLRADFDPDALPSATSVPRPEPVPERHSTGNELSYENWIDSKRRFKCLYGYVADKTGDHRAAIQIFEDCIRRWNDVYSMIWLAQIYESGVSVPRDPAYATALMQRGAETGRGGYSSLARYHFGVALVEGRGVAPDEAGGLYWLRRARDEGVDDAADYLSRHFPGLSETPEASVANDRR